jgi:hypothetical protein
MCVYGNDWLLVRLILAQHGWPLTTSRERYRKGRGHASA